MSAWWGDYVNAGTVKEAAKNVKENRTAEDSLEVDVQALKNLVRYKDRISEALGQRIANAEQEIQDCLEVLDFLDPDYAKRLRELSKTEKEDLK